MLAQEHTPPAPAAGSMDRGRTSHAAAAPRSSVGSAVAASGRPVDALGSMLARCVACRGEQVADDVQHEPPEAGRSAAAVDDEEPIALAGGPPAARVRRGVSTGGRDSVLIQRANGHGAAAPATMAIARVGGPTAGQCGAFTWQVNFTLPTPSLAGGYFVQEVRPRVSTTDCAGVAVAASSFNYRFWEAWRVLPGGTQDELVANGTYTFADQYSAPSRGVDTKGSFAYVGSVRFYEGLALPPSFIANNPATIAGELPSTAVDPGLAGGTPALDHSIAGTWDCCPWTAFGYKVPFTSGARDTVITSHSP